MQPRTTNADTPVSSSAVSRGNRITKLNDNDVILGRGAGPRLFEGNLLFQSRIKDRHDEYVSVTTNVHKTKAMIAKEIVEQTHHVGGRFLKPVEGERQEVWYEKVSYAVAVEKCKQALRDYRKKQGPSDGNESRNNGEKKGDGGAEGEDKNKLMAQDVGNEGVGSTPATIGQRRSTSDCPFGMGDKSAPLVPSTLFGSKCTHCVGDVRPLLFQAHRRYLASSALSPQLLGAMAWQIGFASAEHGQHKRRLSVGRELVTELDSRYTLVAPRPSASEEDASASEEDMSDFLMSLMTSDILDKPKITEEQVKLERAAMTDEEKMEAVTDVFGRNCAVTIAKVKRARREVDENPVGFLVNQMRLELGQIPADKKRAFLEAQTRCSADEFSDARLEKFLRCERLNVKLGAQRFVKYWESRREVFGPDKFVLPLTLSEALCDDSDALEACIYSPLPRLDASGRQLLYFDSRRHTREGYTRESMLRAVWYVMEVLAQTNNDLRSGYVFVCFLKDFSMWDFDLTFYGRLLYFDNECWPVRRIATHKCCPPSFFIKVIQPVTLALAGKYGRFRRLCHEESNLLDSLSECGILKEMLPTEMGGTVRLNQADWIASRRAEELEEICS